MGAENYMWVTRYQKSLAKALDMARRETFAAGKFLGAEKMPKSIAAAVEAAAEVGTGSLLDIIRVSKTPELCSVCPVSAKERKAFFGTEHPDGSEIADAMDFWESFDRGMARAVTLYEQGRPVKICFAGWTLDAPTMGNGSYEEVDERKLPPPEKKAPKEPEMVGGVWVGAMGGDHEGLPAFLRIHGDVLWKILFKPFSEEFGTLISFYRMMARPERIRYGRLLEILETIAKLAERHPCCYSLSVNSAGMASCGMTGNEEIRHIDEAKTILTTIRAGYEYCKLKKEQVQYEEGKCCKVIEVVEERDLRGEHEVPLGNGIVKIGRRKISQFVDCEQLAALLEALSKCDKGAYLKHCTGEWPLKNGQPVMPNWPDEAVVIPWSELTPEERTAELSFFKNVLQRMSDGTLCPQTPEWEAAKKRCAAYFLQEDFKKTPEYIAGKEEYDMAFSCLTLDKTPAELQQWRRGLQEDLMKRFATRK